jgi:hypothetical protein
VECSGWQKFCNKKGLGRIGWLSGHIVRKVWKVGVCVCVCAFFFWCFFKGIRKCIGRRGGFVTRRV